MRQEDRLLSLTGLRFLAVLLVVIQHLQGHFGVPQLGLNFGQEATALFFVLSGFVLSYAYREGFSADGPLRRFYFSRWARIWPLHALCLIVALVLVTQKPGFLSQPDWPARILGNLLLVHAWVPVESWVMSFNSVSWFLSVLVLGYAIFPLLRGETRRTGLLLGIWLALLVLVLILANNLLPESWNAIKLNLVMFHPLVRVVDFLVGVLLGNLFVELRFRRVEVVPDPRFREVEEESATGQFVEGTDIGDLKIVRSARTRQRLKRVSNTTEELSSGDTFLEIMAFAAAAGFIGSMIFLHWDRQLGDTAPFGDMMAFWIRSLLGTMLSAGIVWSLAGRQGLVSQLLGSPVGQYLGCVSFAFYMSHQLVIRSLSQFGWNTQLPAVVPAFLIGLLCLAVAVIVYHLIEMPIRSLLDRLEDRCNRLELEDRQAMAEGMLAFRDACTRFIQGIKTPTTLTAFAVLALAAAAVYGSHVPAPPKPPEKQWVSRPFFGRSEIVFQEEAVLHAVQVDPTDKGVQLTMYWKRLPSSKRNRSIHLVDSSGKIVGYAAQDQEAFKRHPFGTVFQETLTIPSRQLQGIQKIGIGFFHPEHKGAPVSRGNRSMNGRRLDIDLTEVF